MKKIVFCIALILVSVLLRAQGCSDAGFCTLGNFKPLYENSSKQKLTLSFANGIGDEGVYVFTPAVQYDIRLNKQWQLQTKATANYASGNLGSAFGLGDFYLSGTYILKNKSKWQSSFLFGIKIPFNTSNLKQDGKSLPMQYQSSLGTFDVIGGYTITNQKWLFATALQLPLSGKNNNNFLPAYFANTAALKYPKSNDFDRKADVLLRANYNIKQSNKIKLNAGLLGIYHLGKDTYIDGNISNKPLEINGSDGLTLNITGAAQFALSKKIDVGLLAGVPLVVRDVRPDGLTRSFSISTDFIFKF